MKLNGNLKLVLHLCVIASLTLFALPTSAETVWCRNFNLGCPTEKELEKKRRNCYNLALEVRRSSFIEAISDPSVWKLGGYISAEDYAEARMRNMLFTCNKN